MAWLLIGILAIFAQPVQKRENHNQAEYAYQIETQNPQDQNEQRPATPNNQNASADGASQHEGQPQEKQNHWYDAFTPPTWSTWALVFIGWLGVWAAIATFLIIGWQAVETRKAAEATRISAKAAEDGVRLQKALKRQWLDLEDWRVEGPKQPLGEMLLKIIQDTTITIHFDIMNLTDMPLKLRAVELFVISRKKYFRMSVDLNPKARVPIDFPIILEQQEPYAYVENLMVLNLFGLIDYIDAFGDRQRQRFGKMLTGGTDGFDFAEFHGWLPDEEEEDEE